jgi:hypothetical protein
MSPLPNTLHKKCQQDFLTLPGVEEVPVASMTSTKVAAATQVP